MIFRYAFVVSLFVVSGLFSIDVDRSVVQLSVEKQFYSTDPWKALSRMKISGSGFVVSNNRILTNAHNVNNAVHITVHLHGFAKMFPAKVVAIGHDCDLALLEIEDEEFSFLTEPVIFGKEITPGEELTVIGYFGSSKVLSSTKGISSPSHHYIYAYSKAILPCVELGASMKLGQSGGPVVSKGKVVGVAFQKLVGFAVDSTSFIIPITVINHFLEEAHKGEYKGFPLLQIDFQTLENPYLRDYFSLGEDTTGVLVTSTKPGCPLKKGDIITAIDAIHIQNDGSIYRHGVRKDLFLYMLVEKHVGDTIKFNFIRQGVPKTCVVTIKNSFRDLVKRQNGTYYVYAGFVFNTTAENAEEKSCVQIAKVLPHEVNVGYDFYKNVVVEKIGNNKLVSIKQLVDYLESDQQYHILTLEDGREIILDGYAKKKNAEILEKFQVVSDRFIL